MSLGNNYYVSSFIWSTLSKILSAIVGFISVPLLLGYYGKAEYGILSIATACNSYMHLLDLGMNIGAVKFFSQWKAEGNIDKIYRVARTNITFYGIIALINIAGLLLLAFFGRSFFSITDAQFVTLQKCLIIIALFSILSWGATTFNQLLIAYKQMSFTMQMQCVSGLLKGALVACVFMFDWSLLTYFFFLTAVISLLIVPYAIRCRQYKLIDRLMPATYWKDFKVVLMFSLSIFALSLFQATATQSRPIILSMFANDGAEVVADFRIIEVVPAFVIMICGTLSGIFLPQTSEIYARGNQSEINRFAYRGTIITSILACVMSMPFMLCSVEILTAYVGSTFSYLSRWLIIWLVLILCQVHSTPTNALILAKGKTEPLVWVSCIACIISIITNILLAKIYDAGSAVLGYTVYILINLSCYYLLFYKQLLKLDRKRILLSFLIPTVIGCLSMLMTLLISDNICIEIGSERIEAVVIVMIKSVMFIVIYTALLYGLSIIRLENGKIITILDKKKIY